MTSHLTGLRWGKVDGQIQTVSRLCTFITSIWPAPPLPILCGMNNCPADSNSQGYQAGHLTSQPRLSHL